MTRTHLQSCLENHDQPAFFFPHSVWPSAALQGSIWERLSAGTLRACSSGGERSLRTTWCSLHNICFCPVIHLLRAWDWQHCKEDVVEDRRDCHKIKDQYISDPFSHPSQAEERVASMQQNREAHDMQGTSQRQDQIQENAKGTTNQYLFALQHHCQHPFPNTTGL